MKVYIPNSPDEEFAFNKLNGKSLFCYRLGRELRNLGVDVTDDPKKTVEISLNVIRLSHTKSKIRVLRLNGVYHNSGQDYKAKNRRIKESLQMADAVVYQSYHSKLLCNSFIGMPTCPNTIIFNGADPNFYDYYPEADYGNKKVIVAISKWRPHKRLRDIIESFLLANIENSVLVVVGDTSKSGLTIVEHAKYLNCSAIDFTGYIQQTLLAQIINRADLALHLCWFDACPNSVVELLCAGVSVITNNVGGTHELLRVCQRADLIANIDTAYNYLPVDLYHPPKIEREKIASKINYALLTNKTVHSEPFHIQNIAAHYKNFFEELLNGSR